MKPKVICHVMASVDGHLQVERWNAPYESGARDEIMSVYPKIAQSLCTDAWTFGRNTVREIFPDTFDRQEDIVAQPSIFFAERHSDRMFISFDPASDIVYSASQLRGNDILTVMPVQTATTRYLSFLKAKGISYMVVKNFNDTRRILESINEHFGIRAISLQGGGMLNGGMLNSGVIDELSLVVYPGLDCMKDSVSIFEDTLPDAVANTRLELLSAKPMTHGAVWLRYRVHVM